MAIPWYRGEYEIPTALAKRERSMAPFRLGGQLGKGAGQLLGATRERMKTEDEENAEMARLRGVLGLGSDTARSQPDQRAMMAPGSEHPDATEQQSTPQLDQQQGGEARSAAEIDPTSDQTRNAEVSAQAEGGTPQSASGVIQAIRGKPAGPLRRIADTAMVGLGLRRDQERAGRLAQIGAMKGQAERQRLQRVTAGQMAGIARDTEDPGAFFEQVDPSLGFTPGSIKMRPDLEKPRSWTEGSLAYEAGSDPKAAAALDRMEKNRTARIVALANARRAGGVGGGGPKPAKNIVELAQQEAARVYGPKYTSAQLEVVLERLSRRAKPDAMIETDEETLPDMPPVDTEESAGGLSEEELRALFE